MKIFKFQNVYFLIVQTKKCSYFENVRIKKMLDLKINWKKKLKRKIKNEKKNGKKKTENKTKKET